VSMFKIFLDVIHLADDWNTAVTVELF